jgi:anti-sigma factor RsiW
MSDDLKNILGNSNKDIDNQKLMDYLSGKLNAPDAYELEKHITDDEFLSDAVEGLQEIKDPQALSLRIDELHRDLQKKIAQKKSRKSKLHQKIQPTIIFAIVLILLLAVICLLIIRKLHLF